MSSYPYLSGKSKQEDLKINKLKKPFSSCPKFIWAAFFMISRFGIKISGVEKEKNILK